MSSRLSGYEHEIVIYIDSFIDAHLIFIVTITNTDPT